MPAKNHFLKFCKHELSKHQALTKVAEMHDGMEPGVEKYEWANHLVKVDVVVKGQYGRQTQAPQQCDRMPQDEE